MLKQRMARVVFLIAVLVVGCTPGQGQPSQSQTSGRSPEQPRQSQTLVVAHRYEPANLATKVQGSNGPLRTTRLFNAALVLYDVQGAPRPYLAERLPQLNTDAWRVFPDGRMETTYQLRDGLTWHDGAPLTAEDFAFAFRVYRHPDLGVFLRVPQAMIDSVLAPDARTVVIQWRTAFPDAGILSFGDLDPLPSHLLAASFAEMEQADSSRESFLGNSFWTVDYVGAGPYRLERWEPGVQLVGRAFAGHVLGEPKIDRIVVRITIDENSVLAAVLAGGQFHYTNTFTLRFEHLLALKRDWEPAGKGFAAAVPTTAVYLNLQQRPEFVGDDALLDVRVRRALAHTLDRDALNEGLFNGIGFPTESIVPPSAPFFPDLERAMTKYPLDANRANQLMAEAGYTRDSEGFFVNAQGRRVRVDFTVQASAEIERMQAILSDDWRRKGFDVHPNVMGVTLFTELRTRHTLPGLAYSLGPSEGTFAASEIGSAANGWAGLNRTGWTHPEYERLRSAADTALDQGERGRYVAQMLGLVSEYLPGYPLYFGILVQTRVAALKGPDDEHQFAGFGQVSKGTTNYWNIHEWTLQ
jgi:peptide/nickel transport system substrate-binding protein